MKIAVYCSSSDLIEDKYHEIAVELGKWISEGGHTLIYGGTFMGLMGTLARTVEKKGGERIGIISQSIYEMEGVVVDKKSSEIVKTLEDRKRRFATLADAHIVLPGGFGTFDEAFAILALTQIGENSSPIAFFNISGFYDDLETIFDKIYKESFAPIEFEKKYHFCRSIDDISTYLLK